MSNLVHNEGVKIVASFVSNVGVGGAVTALVAGAISTNHAMHRWRPQWVKSGPAVQRSYVSFRQVRTCWSSRVILLRSEIHV
jgi:hypothetical protein